MSLGEHSRMHSFKFFFRDVLQTQLWCYQKLPSSSSAPAPVTLFHVLYAGTIYLSFQDVSDRRKDGIFVTTKRNLRDRKFDIDGITVADFDLGAALGIHLQYVSEATLKIPCTVLCAWLIQWLPVRHSLLFDDVDDLDGWRNVPDDHVQLYCSHLLKWYALV